ncbi:phasin family protein, partial [Streptococcus pneumoniae]
MNHYENDDRRNDDASFGDQAERFSRKLSDSAQQVWLAGLGALGRAQAEGSRFFDGLVKEGEAWEARRRERNSE